MEYRKANKLLLLPLSLASLSGCQTGGPALSANADRYDSQDVTVATLEADGCMAFEDMYFARGEEKDHVFRFKGDEITEHVTCPKVKFDAKNFDDILDKPLFEAIQKVGIPSFRGLEKDHSVTYLCKDGIERSLSLTYDADSSWVITNIVAKEFSFKWYGFLDEETTYKPSLERCKKIKMGMYINDVLSILGRPCRCSDNNDQVACWGISSGGTIHIRSWLEYEGSPFFDSSILERDDLFLTTEIKKDKQTVEVPRYWSVFRLNFSKNEPEAFDDPNTEFME